MFKVDNYLKCGIFNDLLIKRFEENFSTQSNSRLWITPGHIVFTTNDTTVHTYDARPYDFSISPSEIDTDELLVSCSPILDIFFDTESTSTRMFVVLINGDVQIFEYRILLFEWARIGYFNVNITSPNSNNDHHIILTQVLVSQYQNMIYWIEKCGNSDMCFTLHKREVPLNGVREITQSAIGIPKKLLKNCSKFDIMEIRDNICIIPYLPNSVNLYIILSARLHVWFFHIDGKLLWRGIISDSPLDFVSLCAKTVGLWHQSGYLKVCKLLDNVKNYAYILHNEKLLVISPNGEIRRKLSLDISLDTVDNSFIMQDILMSFTNSFENLHIYSIKNGQCIQSFTLKEYAPISGIWRHSSSIPNIGFYSNNAIYKLNYKSLNSLLISDSPCVLHVLNLLKNEHYHVFALLRDLVHHKFESSDIPSLQEMPDVIQSEALLLAVLQSCREKGFKSRDFPLKNMNMLFSDTESIFCKTKLKELLSPLVECFIKLEKSRLEDCQVYD